MTDDLSRHPSRSALHALWAAGVIGGLGISAAGAAGALLMVEVTGGGAMAGLPQTAVVLGAAGAAVVIGAGTRRVGRRGALATGALMGVPGALIAAAGGWVGSAAAVLVGSLLLGAAQAAMMLARYAAADLAPAGRRARAMATVLVATTVGTVLGPNLMPAAGALARSLGGPALTGPYLLAAATSLLAAATLAAGLRGSRPVVAPAGTDPSDGLDAVAGEADAAAPTVRPDRREPAAWRRMGPGGWRRLGPGTWRRRLGPAGVAGIATLALANLVMVGVMTMAPVHLETMGVSLGGIGLVISLHIAAMFAPSPVSGALADRWGPGRVARAGGGVLVAACLLAAAGADSHVVLPVGLVLLGFGWNLCLVSGSLLLTAPATPGPDADVVADRARREGWGEAAMGLAAAGGGALSGVLVAAAGYRTLAVAGAVMAALLLPVVRGRLRTPVGAPTAGAPV
jgi:MFS family permease